MNLKEAYEKRRLEVLTLQRQVKKLEKTVEEQNAGAYVNTEKAAHLKQICHLARENKRLLTQCGRYESYWRRQMDITSNLDALLFDARQEIDSLKKENARLLAESAVLQGKIDALADALAKETAKNDNDGTNSGLPTSRTAIGKQKVIPNSREKSGRKRGGQPGHKKHSLPPLSEDAVTETVAHTLDRCPGCGSENLTFIGRREKDEIDYEIRIIRRRHYFYEYACDDCGGTVHFPIPASLKEQAQYGCGIQTLSLALLNLGYVSINRIQKILNGFLGDGIAVSQGYIAKLQKRASSSLAAFVEDVRLECICSKILHWDDTVIFVNTARACMRFYGNDRVALFKAHEKKDRAGIDEDAVLSALGPETVVVHDHNTINYNGDFHFRNAECCAHLMRELQKLADISHHKWPAELKDLISSTIRERNALVGSGRNAFCPGEIQQFLDRVETILSTADKESAESAGHYYEKDETNLIRRIREYAGSYFLWTEDFAVPPTNNLAERELRPTKTKQKVSGQYQSVQNAAYFADIRTYIETCAMHGADVFAALSRLASGNPYTVAELLGEA